MRHVVQAFHKGLEVQHGATHQQRQFAARSDVCHQAPRIDGKFSRAVGVQRVADVDQMVRHRCQLFCRGFGCANVHAAVNQGGVDADDLHRPTLCNRQCGCRFAGGGGTDQAQVTRQRGIFLKHDPRHLGSPCVCTNVQAVSAIKALQNHTPSVSGNTVPFM